MTLGVRPGRPPVVKQPSRLQHLDRMSGEAAAFVQKIEKYSCLYDYSCDLNLSSLSGISFAAMNNLLSLLFIKYGCTQNLRLARFLFRYLLA